MKIVVVGLGYVGMSNAVLLAQHHQVVGLEIDERRARMLNERRSPIQDPEIEKYLQDHPLALHATCDPAAAYAGADYVFVATPTDFNPTTNYFDTSSIDSVIRDVKKHRPEALIVIRATVPIGYTDSARREHGIDSIIFCPEFLREGCALQDSLHPTRIVVGNRSESGQSVAALLLEGALRKDAPVLLTESTEAEAIKLFANTYLAMRVAFFNELDTFAVDHGLDAREIIDGVSLDPRVGQHYNNPSFGYGGYCLPKDTKQLLANYRDLPQALIGAVVGSNTKRMDFIAADILKRGARVVGIHRLVMKAGSDNHRASSVQGIMQRLKSAGVELMVYEPIVQDAEFMGFPVERDLAAFKNRADLIVTNRTAPELEDVSAKVYTRDLYASN